MEFYAGHDYIFTDIAVFHDEAKRDEWIKNATEYDFYPRCDYPKELASEILGADVDTYEHYEVGDPFNENIVKWLINPINITKDTT